MISQLAISLDIYLDNGTYTAKQSDAGSRYLLISITDNGTATEIESNAVVNLKARKPSGAVSYDHGTVTDGKALILLTSDTLAEAGMVYCELEITQIDPVALLKTLTFKLDVKSEVYSQTIPESTSTFTALTEALAAAGSIGKVSDLKTEDKSTLVAGVNEIHDEVVDLQNDKEDKSNKVTSIDSESTDIQYPSAKLTYDQLATKEPNLPATPLLPAEKFLNGNKAWAIPAHNKLTDLNTDTEYQHMSSAEKTKLNTIARGSVRVGLTNNVAGDLVAKTDKQILIGDGNDLKSVAVSGDVTISNTGAVTIGNNKVTNAKLAQMNTKTIKGNDTAGTANAKDLTVAETKALLDIDDLEAQVNSVPVSGTSKALTKSLSNTSAGITQALTVKGLTATQLVQNGNFVNGTTGWSAANGTITVVNGILLQTCNGTARFPIVFRSISPTVATHKYYAYCKARVTNADCISIELKLTTPVNEGIKTQYTPTINQWYELLNIITIQNSYQTPQIAIQHVYIDSPTASGKVMEVQYCYAIDLTARFGAGNEPDLATCQTLFPSYFDGTISVDKGEVTIGTGTSITRARYPKLQSVPAIQDTYNVLSGLHTQNVQTVATTNGTAINTTNYPLAKNAVGFVIALTAGGTQTGTVGTDTASGDGTLYYQLATPVLTYYPPKSIPLPISSTLQHQSIIGDIAFYSTGIAISDSDYPIETLQEVILVNTDDGTETPIDIATCTVASGGLSFTSTALTDGDLVWFRYEHTLDSATPTTEYTYTTSLAGGLTTIQQDVKKQNESLQKQIDELRAIIASMAV